MAVNKIVFGSEALIDLTSDDVTPMEVLAAVQRFHGNYGLVYAGTCTFDVDSSDCNALKSEILEGRTAAVNGEILTGNMPNNGAITGNIATKSGQYTVPQGYHDGSGYVQIELAEQQKIIGDNIKTGITILGVTGTYGGESARVQAKTATPSKTQQIIVPDSGYDYLSQVTVNAIPYVETANPYGTTVTIG